MADRKYWLGGASARGKGYGTDYDADWEFDSAADATYGNWILADGTVTTKPGADDIVIYDKHAAIVPSDYSQSPARHTIGKHFNCIDNVDKGASGGLDFEAVVVTREFTGMVGEDLVGTIEPLCVSIKAGGYIYVASNETIHIRCAWSDGTTSSNIPLVVFDSVTGNLLLSSDCNDATYFASFDKIEIVGSGGTLELKLNDYDDYTGTEDPEAASLGYGAVVGELYAAKDFTGTVSVEATCVDRSDSDAPIDYEIYGGVFYIDSALGTTRISGATTLVQLGSSDVDLTDKLDIGNIEVYDGSFVWNCYGDIIGGKQFGGTISATGDGDKMLGTDASASTDFEQYGGTFTLAGQFGKMEMGAGRKLLHRGGTFVPARNSNIVIENLLTL